MALAFPWPYTQGEWLAWAAAIVTVLIGIALMVVPRLGMRALGLTRTDDADAVALTRSLVGGFYAGIGVSAIFLAQPLIYFTLGFAWALAAFGRVVSMLADGGATIRNGIALALTLPLAALPLAYALGFLR